MKKLLLLFFLTFYIANLSSQNCYEQNSNGVIILEAENLIIPGTTDNRWTIIEDPNVGGGKYIRWDGPDRFNKNLPKIGRLTANIKINTPNIPINFLMRMRQSREFLDGTNVRGDLANDVFIYFPPASQVLSQNQPTNPFTFEKVFGSTRVAGGFNPNRAEDHFRVNGNFDFPNGRRPTVVVSYPTEGMYTIEIAARSKGFQLDRILLYPGGRNSANNNARLEAINLNTPETLCTTTPLTPQQIEAARIAQIRSEAVRTGESAFIIFREEGGDINEARTLYNNIIDEIIAADGAIPLITSRQQEAQDAFNQLQNTSTEAINAQNNAVQAAETAETTSSLTEARNALADAENQLTIIQNISGTPFSTFVDTAEQMAVNNELYATYSSVIPDPRPNRSGQINVRLIYEREAATAAATTRQIANSTANLAATTDVPAIVSIITDAVNRARIAVETLGNSILEALNAAIVAQADAENAFSQLEVNIQEITTGANTIQNQIMILENVTTIDEARIAASSAESILTNILTTRANAGTSNTTIINARDITELSAMRTVGTPDENATRVIADNTSQIATNAQTLIDTTQVNIDEATANVQRANNILTLLENQEQANNLALAAAISAETAAIFAETAATNAENISSEGLGLAEGITTQSIDEIETIASNLRGRLTNVMNSQSTVNTAIETITQSINEVSQAEIITNGGIFETQTNTARQSILDSNSRASSSPSTINQAIVMLQNAIQITEEALQVAIQAEALSNSEQALENTIAAIENLRNVNQNTSTDLQNTINSNNQANTAIEAENVTEAQQNANQAQENANQANQILQLIEEAIQLAENAAETNSAAQTNLDTIRELLENANPSDIINQASTNAQNAQETVDKTQEVLNALILELENQNSVVFPNPINISSALLSISNIRANENGRSIIRIFNSQGRQVLFKDATVDNRRVQISLPSSIQTGLYFAVIESINNGRESIAFIAN